MIDRKKVFVIKGRSFDPTFSILEMFVAFIYLLTYICQQDPSSPHSLGNPEESNTANMSQLKLTKPAPEFRGTAVVNGDFKQISLSDFRGKYVVFFFYPLDL